MYQPEDLSQFLYNVNWRIVFRHEMDWANNWEF